MARTTRKQQTRYDLKVSKRDLLPSIRKNVRPLEKAG